MIPLFSFITETSLMIIAGLAFLFFGNRLPSAMRSLGRGVNEFKKGIDGIDDDRDGLGPKSIDPPK